MNTLLLALIRQCKSISSALKNINWYTLLDYESAATTAADVTLENASKFSDYSILTAQIIDNNLGYFRAFACIPVDLFKSHPLSISFVNSANQQFWIELTYKSDTVVQVQSSASANTYKVCLQGIKL